MRKFLLFVGWTSLFGSIVDVAIVLFAVFLILTQTGYGWTLSSETLFQVHLTFLLWIKQIAYFMFNHELVAWVFAQSAVALFTLRAIVSTFIGNWALKAAKHC